MLHREEDALWAILSEPIVDEVSKPMEALRDSYSNKRYVQLDDLPDRIT